MRNTEVQLDPEGATIETPHYVDQLTSEEFEQFAAQVAEAHANKQGFEIVTCPAKDAQIGDHLFGRRIINVRDRRYSDDLVTINTNPFGWMVFHRDDELTVQRVIR